MYQPETANPIARQMRHAKPALLGHDNGDEDMSAVDALRLKFSAPPSTHGPVPFFWWAGEKLDRARLAWQLDQLREKGIRQLIVSYPHGPDGLTDVGDPPLFSSEWWDLFRWFLQACRERGMTVGFQDYTLVEPTLHLIGRETEGMEGGQMSCVAERVTGACVVRLSVEPQTHVLAAWEHRTPARPGGSMVPQTRLIGAWAYPMTDGVPVVGDAIDLGESLIGGSLEWNAPGGKWFVALVYARISPFDPMHPEAGNLAISKLYQPFERECPGEVGKTLSLFFQDELDFGSRMPFWSKYLFDAFDELKGYDLRPWLPALWHDMGPMTEKVRLDYADVTVTRLENCYFKPVFRWHEERGILFGHDNCGRGRMAQGRSHYGDYFRTMRWFSAPGCDDPKLQGARAFKGLKVNSSIAHFYHRPRVWVEAFHSSGWGTTPAEVVTALNEDFAYGATVVNLHGLFYSTRGGWWEWAPPDFHFRQPYWIHSGPLNGYLTRLSWLLSQGDHRCDVAILYPIASLHAEAADPSQGAVVAHMGNEVIGGGEPLLPKPEDSAFGLGKFLFDHACDFDFIDDESMASAKASEGELRAGPGRYRVLILPAMAAVCFKTLEKALDFVRSGGLLMAYGHLPGASDRAGREDPVLDAMLRDIFGTGDDSPVRIQRHAGGGIACLIRKGYGRVLEIIDETIERDVISSEPLHVLHRQVEERDVYFIFNPSEHEITSRVVFRCEGTAAWWNAWTGETTAAGNEKHQPIRLGAREAKLLVFEQSGGRSEHQASPASADPHTEILDGPWRFNLHPTLNNRYGDFSLPADDVLIGPQARRFLYADESDDGLSEWRKTTYSFGPRLEVTGPLPPGSEFPGDANCDWRPYEFSLRWGIERDPFLTHWLSGPHGLKGRMPDEFLDFHSDVPGSVWYVRTKVVSPRDGTFSLLTGARCIYQVWVNGEPAVCQKIALPPGFYPPWSIPHYECVPLESTVRLHQGENDILIKLVQPEGQRTRAFLAFDPPAERADQLALRWFTDPASLHPCLPAPASRRAIRFRFACPPGATGMSFVSRGYAKAWIGDMEQALVLLEQLSDNTYRYQSTFSGPCITSAEITLRVEAPAESRGGDALPEPVCFTCGDGLIALGDWCSQGLATYSGAVTYKSEFNLPERKSKFLLDLGSLNATAEVQVNGSTVAALIMPPWICDISDFVRTGTNELSITVANSLANHYSVNNPSPYAFGHQTPSGLFGPVTLQSS